jgi:hypothetical protein
MWEPEVFPRELQNHRLHGLHRTTQAGEWIPQYEHACSGRLVGSSTCEKNIYFFITIIFVRI